MKPHRYFINVMTKEQKLKFIGLVILWLGALVWFWSCWLRENYFVALWGMHINSVVIGWTLILPAYSFFFVYRMKIANLELNPPDVSYALSVTQTPSKPWSVEATALATMLRQKFPYKHNIRSATETIALRHSCPREIIAER